MNLNGTEYYYIRNAQGDIVGLFDKTGTQVVAYTYDTWGKLISTTGTLASTVGAKNPYRYRGYRYDGETGLYYLNARYYNAEWGRFINADSYIGTPGELLSCNMFAYCGNNPVNRDDPNGEFWGLLAAAFAISPLAAVAVTVILAVAVALIVIAVVTVAVATYRNSHISYSDSSSSSGPSSSKSSGSSSGRSSGNNTSSKVNKGNTSNPISDAMENRIPNSKLNPPKKRGNSPTSKKDGKPIEIHHKNQDIKGPFEELSRTDHRLGENYGINHPNFREKSIIDRKQFAKDVRNYWRREWDSGRWSK